MKRVHFVVVSVLVAMMVTISAGQTQSGSGADRLNADVFSTQYRDMQINFLIPGTNSDTKTRNAGRARIHGVEVDVALVL